MGRGAPGAEACVRGGDVGKAGGALRAGCSGLPGGRLRSCPRPRVGVGGAEVGGFPWDDSAPIPSELSLLRLKFAEVVLLASEGCADERCNLLVYFIYVIGLSPLGHLYSVIVCTEADRLSRMSVLGSQPRTFSACLFTCEVFFLWFIVGYIGEIPRKVGAVLRAHLKAVSLLYVNRVQFLVPTLVLKNRSCSF